MSKIKLTGSNSGYVEISSAADAGNLTLALPTSGTRLLSDGNNVYTGITTFTNDLKLEGGSYDVLWDASDNQLEFDDNSKLSFGASSDLQLYHDGTHSYVDEVSNGNLVLRTNPSGTYSTLVLQSGRENSVICNKLGSVELYHIGGVGSSSKKVETTSTGAIVTGICTATSFSGSGENLTRTTQLSHRNVVINGGMEIAQRGTTSTGNTSGGYKTCDRWELSLTSAGTWTVTRSGTCPDGFKHSLKLDCTTANTSLSSTSFLSIRTAFEGQDLRRFAKGTTSAKPITVSFYVKTNKNGTYAVELYDVDNTKIATSLYTVSDNNWNRYEFTIPASTNTGQFVNDTNKSLTLGFILAAGTNYTNGTQYGTFVQGSNLNRAAGLTVNLADSTSNDFYLTGVQMEEGSVATPFEHKSFTEELTRCYRYYRRFGANGSLPTPAPYNRFSIGYSPSSSDVRFPFQLDPPMRINPTNSNFSKSGSFSIQPGSIGSYSLTCDNNSCSPSMLIAIMGSTSVSSGAGSAVSLHANNDTSAYIEISAEL